MRRQRFLRAAACGAVAPAVLASCTSTADEQRAAGHLRRPIGWDGKNDPLLLTELVRHATLAPSSHNTQCWRFRLGADAIAITPDLERRCPVVDPDDHHLFVSLGCAAENLVQAASAHGLNAEARFDAGSDAGSMPAPMPARPTPSRSPSRRRGRSRRRCTRRSCSGSARAAPTTPSRCPQQSCGCTTPTSTASAFSSPRSSACID